MIDPKPVAGMSPDSAWLNRLREMARTLRLLPGRGYRIKRWPDGYTLEFDESGGGSGVGAPSTLSFYLFQSHGLKGPPDQTDYILASPLAGGGTTLILKPPLLRFSVKSHGSINYDTYDPVGQTRNAHGSGLIVVQTITPMYVKGDILYVQSVGTGLYDMNVDNRTFAGP